MPRPPRALRPVARLPLVTLLAAGCGGGEGAAIAPPEPPPLAAGVTISEVALYQGLKVTLARGGKLVAQREVPVVRERPALMRVSLTTAPGWVKRQVTVRLALTAGGVALDPMEQTVTPRTPRDEDLASTVNFDLAPGKVTADLQWSLTVSETSSDVDQPGSRDGAAFPPENAGGQAALKPGDTGEALRIVLLPVEFNSDGSGRMPRLGDAQVGRLRDAMFALYPARRVDVTVAEPLAWSRSVTPDGRGWGSLLNAVAQRRLDDGAPRNVYYYGLFSPATSFRSFCSRGCVLGLSALSDDPDDDTVRASIGIGFDEDTAAATEASNTFVHEVGHAHGREHSPCGLVRGDPGDAGYPHEGARIGVWGYDLVTRKLHDPDGRDRDLMSYCEPTWISDYTYQALYDRIRYVNAHPYRRPAEGDGARWRTYVLEGDRLVEGGTTLVPASSGGRPRTLERVDSAGRVAERVTARYYPFDHLPGGLLHVPAGARLDGDPTATLRLDGRALQR